MTSIFGAPFICSKEFIDPEFSPARPQFLSLYPLFCTYWNLTTSAHNKFTGHRKKDHIFNLERIYLSCIFFRPLIAHTGLDFRFSQTFYRKVKKHFSVFWGQNVTPGDKSSRKNFSRKLRREITLSVRCTF